MAEVNGKGIAFADLEAARVSVFVGLASAPAEPDEATLHKQYRYVLTRLIEEMIVCVYMEKKGIAPEAGALEAEEARIRADYPEGAFEEMLLNLGLDLEDWRKRLYRRLMVEHFASNVLRPEISISSDEAQEYYRAHSAEFVIPELWHFLRILGRDSKTVEAARADLVAGQNADAVRKKHLVTIHDINIGMDLLADDVAAVLKPLKPGQSSKIEKSGDEWRALLLLQKSPVSIQEPAEISRRIEQALTEEKVPAIYATWLQNQLKKSKVRISPALLEEYKPPAASSQ
ncbi:MAG: peptidyl-prolyl cis-trans isomerase [Desulfovibrio sp.]|nr:peptidyl-prolyl cis-trans isomerase [Desulfovibrio sp.]